MAMLLWLIPATIASKSINICSEIHSQVFYGGKSIHLLSHEETVCNSATVIPSATFQKNVICNVFDMICTVSVYLKFNCTYYYLPCMEICMFLLQALIDIQMSLIFNESIVIYRVIKCTKKNPIYWNNCLLNQVQCPSI